MIAALKNIGAVFAAFGFVKKFMDVANTFGPFGAIIAPVLKGAAEFLVQIIKWFAEGIAVVFANPVVLTVVLSAMGYGYFEGHTRMSVKVTDAENRIVAIQKAKKCYVPTPGKKPASSIFEQWGLNF